MIDQLVIIVHVLIAMAITGLILIQHGKGADMGASFGAGASQTVFGSQGSGNFLSRTTAILSALFFATSFALAILAKQTAIDSGDLDIPAAVESADLPAGPAPALDSNSEVPMVEAASEKAAEIPADEIPE